MAERRNDQGGVPSGALAGSPQLMGGQSATVSATLKAGSYVLVCLMPGHYQAGQHIPFTVTG